MPEHEVAIAHPLVEKCETFAGIGDRIKCLAKIRGQETYFTDIGITEVKEKGWECRNVTDLNLTHCNLEQIPDGIAKLENLEKLNLSWNKIHKIEKLKNFTLRTLDLTGNRITKVEGLGGVPNLERVLLLENPLENEDCTVLKQSFKKERKEAFC